MAIVARVAVVTFGVVALGCTSSSGSDPGQAIADASAGASHDAGGGDRNDPQDWDVALPDTAPRLVDAWTGACEPRSWRGLPGRMGVWPNWSPDSHLTLLPDGRVLVGFAYGFYHPATDTYDALPPPARLRVGGTATLLADGKTVLFTGGGIAVSIDATYLTDLFDTETRTFRAGPNMKTARTWHKAALMANGKVLVVGGISSDDDDAKPMAEIYDPATN